MKNVHHRIKAYIMKYFPSLKSIFRPQEFYFGAVPDNVVRIAPTKIEPVPDEDTTTREADLVNESVSIVAGSKYKKRSANKKKDEDTPKEEKKEMAEHDDDKERGDKHHHHKDCCCDRVDIPVVIKVFDFCAEKKYYLQKFEDAIGEYYDMYPYVLFKYKKEYCDGGHHHDGDGDHHHHKCRVRFCVYFSLLDYDKAFEIETSLQKKYRHILLRY